MAIKANLVIDQGSSYETVLYITDNFGDVIDLTGYTATAQMRKHYTSLTSINFTTAVDTDDGAVTLSLSANATANITAGRYVYDVEISKSGTVSRIVEGIVTITPNVTRA
jgi:hypothetical protein